MLQLANRLGKCDWFSYVIDGDLDVNSGRGLCQLFDYDPHFGIKTGCTLYKVYKKNGIFALYHYMANTTSFKEQHAGHSENVD